MIDDIKKMAKDKVMVSFVAIECIILLYLLSKAVFGTSTNAEFTGEAFFDNVRQYSYANGVGSDLVIDSKASSDDENELEAYSWLFPLRSGGYLVSVDYEYEPGYVNKYHGYSVDNAVLIVQSHTKDNAVTLQPIVLDGAHNSVTGRLYVPIFSSLDDAELLLTYGRAAELTIHGITIEDKPVYRYMQFLGVFLFFMILDAIYILLFSKYRTEIAGRIIKKPCLVVFAICFVISCMPMFGNFLYSGHDLLYHLNRIDELAISMRNHIFPIRIQTDMLNGYGYDSALLYCDVFLYPSAFLYQYCMLPMRTCYQIYVFAVNFFTILFAYRLFRTLFGDHPVTLIGTVLYSTCLYRLVAIHLRAAEGEYTAMVFLPLVAEGVYRIYHSVKPKFEDWVPLAVGMACLAQCHMLSVEISTFMLLILFIINIRRLTVVRFFSFVKAAIISIMICLWTLVPNLDSMFTLKPLFVGGSYRIQWTGAYLTQIFDVFASGSGESLLGTKGDMPIGIGGGLIVGLIIIAWYSIFGKVPESDVKNKGIYDTMMSSFVLGSIAIWVSTYYFPLDTIARILMRRFDFIRSMLEGGEFMWRYLGTGSMCLSIAASCALYMAYEQKRQWFRVFVIAMMFFSFVSVFSFYHNLIFQTNNMPYTEVTNEDRMYVSSGADDLELYMSDGAEDPFIHTEGTAISLVSYRDVRGTKELICKNNGDSDTNLLLPLFDFVNYHAYDVSSGDELTLSRSDVNCRLQLLIPAGFDGTVLIKYVPPYYWRISEIVSCITVISLIMFSAVRRRHP